MGRPKTGQGDGPFDPSAQPPEPELVPAFEIHEPHSLSSPVVFSSPHSGSVYPAAFLAASRLDPKTLRRSEDAFVDQLVAAVPELGSPLLAARFPRAYLDVNREPYELDPRMFDGRLPPFANTRSLRVAGGLGTIARVVGESQEIYTKRLPVEEAIARIEGLYKPYHQALRQLLRRAHDRFGLAVLVDVHSMPSTSGTLRNQTRVEADIVLGDRYGTSCDSRVIEIVEYELRQLGYAVQRNKPYAGGFITEHYGSPGAHFHALQIEINRALYMDEQNFEKTASFAQVKADLTQTAEMLIRQVADFGHGQALAAE